MLLLTIPLALTLAGLYFTALSISPVFVALLVGYFILRRPKSSPYLALVLGVVVLVLIHLIPVLGSIVSFLTLLLGLGAVCLVVMARTQHPFLALPVVE